MTAIAIDDLPGVVGAVLGPSPWHTVTADDVARFAAATGGGAGGDRVPPLMVLSLTNRFLPDLLEVTGASSGVNYGTGSVRFGAEVPVGARLRASAEVVDVAEVPGGVQATVRVTHQADPGDGPACVVDTISRYLR